MAGIEDPSVVDLVTHDGLRNEAVLVMTATTSWSQPEVELNQLLEKINGYVVFAIDEELLLNFPDLAGLPIRFRLDTVWPPTDSVLQVVEYARKTILDKHDIQLEVNCLS